MHPPHPPMDAIITDDIPNTSQEPDSQANQQTQSTQQASQPANDAVDGHLWGFLQPCSPALTRIDFWKIHPSVAIGRNSETNDVVLPGFKISNKHCRITWDGKDDRTSAVTVYDNSSNGTFINGLKVGKGCTKILREGNEIAFGTFHPQPQNGGIEDYRFVYRHTAAGPPEQGLYAHYDISNELGKGSFATVMKAISRSTGRWYAVKMIHKDRLNRTADGNPNMSRTAGLSREISILEKLKHPNICQLKEVFYQDGDINLVLELVEGGDLLDYILEREGLAEDMTRHITYQICDALSYIHGMGIAHRDLKPENVLLTSDDPPIVKVADFGLAKVVDSLTMLRTMCGTPSYLAPEVVLQTNHEGYQHVVDSWSVGVIVFSMLTNASPFIEDETQRDLRTRIAERTVDWGTLGQAQVSSEGQSFIRRLLDARPAIRMPLTAARNHPWLQAYVPVYRHRETPSSPSRESLAAEDSMLSEFDEGIVPSTAEDAGVSQGLEHLRIDPSVISVSDSTADMMSTIPGAYPNGRNGVSSAAAGKSVMREGSRKAPLQRRSHVLSQAAEGDQPGLVPEPSWEMIQNATGHPTAGAGPSEAGATTPTDSNTDNVVRGSKRAHSELTPLPEEYESDNKSTSPLGNANSNTARKKGKTSDEDSAGGTGRVVAGGSKKAKGGKSKAKRAGVTRNRANKEDAMDDGEAGTSATPTTPAQKPRRSARQTPQKAARRA